MAEMLSLGLTGGLPSPQFDYDPASLCPVVAVPGSGAEVFLLRSWRATVEALRVELIRDLRAVSARYAVTGATLQHDGGLLRAPPAHARIRQMINPLFSLAEAERMRPAIRVMAVARARRLRMGPARADLAAAYCRPLTADVVTMAAGLADGEYERLAWLSDNTAGALVLSPADRGRIARAWAELYAFCAAVIMRQRAHRRAGRCDGSLTARVVAAMDDSSMCEGEVLDACTTILNGFPTMFTAMLAAAEQLLHPAVLAQTRVIQACPSENVTRQAWHQIVREILRVRAHFTFALPGVTTREWQADGINIPTGAVVLPAIRAAERDITRYAGNWAAPGECDFGRRPRAILAFGLGQHACPGRALTIVALEEALRWLTACNPGLCLAVGPEQIVHLPGAMPVPAKLPVLTGA
jgi:cytochrome P450